MYAPLMINLAVTCVALCLSINTKEEIVKVVAAFIAIVSALLSLIFAPLWVKILIISLPLIYDKFKVVRSPDE